MFEAALYSAAFFMSGGMMSIFKRNNRDPASTDSPPASRRAHRRDPMRNRRRLAYGCTIFAVFWFMQLIWLDALVTFDTAKVVAYLSVPGALLGLPVFRYLRDASRNNRRSNARNSQT